MTTVDQATFVGNVQLGLWRQIWPAAGLAVAVVANLAWIGFLVYAAYDLAILL
jgi:hypothetical protein